MKLKLDHIGLVVSKISEFTGLFRVLGLREMTESEPDPLQKVSASFVTVEEGRKVYIELLEPTDDTSPVANFLKKRGGGLHHLCFEVDDIDATSVELVEKGFQIVSAPVECIGYDKSFKRESSKKSRIAFFLVSNRLLVELLEKGS